MFKGNLWLPKIIHVMKLFQDVQVKEITESILWYAKEKSPTKFLWKFPEKYGRNSNAPIIKLF